MPSSRHRPLFRRQKTFRHTCVYFSNAGNAALLGGPPGAGDGVPQE